MKLSVALLPSFYLRMRADVLAIHNVYSLHTAELSAG